ncbi:Golgin sub A member 2 [Rhizophlyctis rosea]|nr:Golgin sub A member 2 [Rhizophlyctis rosea]
MAASIAPDPILSFTPSFSQYRRRSRTDGEEESDHENSDASTIASDNDDDGNEVSIGISKELLKREKEYIRKNKKIQDKTSQVVKSVEAVVIYDPRIPIRKKGNRHSTSHGHENQVSSVELQKTLEGQLRPDANPNHAQARLALRLWSLQKTMDIIKIHDAATGASENCPPCATTVSYHGQVRRPMPVRTAPAALDRIADQKLGLVPSASANETPLSFVLSEAKEGDSATAKDMTFIWNSEDTANRLLQAKVTVMQEEFDKLLQERESKSQTIASLEQKLKASEEEKVKLNKNLSNLQSNLTSSKNTTTTLTTRLENAETALASLKRDYESLQRSHRQAEQDINAKDVRLNRQAEEIEKLKAAVSRAGGDAKEKLDQARRTNDRLLADIKRLQRQKTELLAAFRKQALLVDVVKRQKMHVEAAKLLQFTEEEFIRALNWEV